MKNGLNVILSFFQSDSIDQYGIGSSSPVDSCVFPKDLGIFIVKIRISLSASKVEKLHYANTVERETQTIISYVNKTCIWKSVRHRYQI